MTMSTAEVATSLCSRKDWLAESASDLYSSKSGLLDETAAETVSFNALDGVEDASGRKYEQKRYLQRWERWIPTRTRRGRKRQGQHSMKLVCMMISRSEGGSSRPAGSDEYSFGTEIPFVLQDAVCCWVQVPWSVSDSTLGQASRLLLKYTTSAVQSLSHRVQYTYSKKQVNGVHGSEKQKPAKLK
ncbi:hypothetical protein BD289DRAFT_84406 [Coniella lustricola]|uniref:Uncharacterized protein n=1 Tax=Coniella lustricola TaxID=2025994 RepID=A0A2T3AHH4_9PEZI|nr:hypothetical protein BD289DRAFT_84406 [Coniella lustricola]